MLEPHTTLGEYKLMSRLGAGGMGRGGERVAEGRVRGESAVPVAPPPTPVATAASAVEETLLIAQPQTAAEVAASTQKHDFEEGMAALRDAESLTRREQLFAELGIAMANGQRLRARELAKRIHEISPRDPDLIELMRELADDAPPPRQRPFRGRRP